MIIRSSENLCKNYEEFSNLARTTGEPLYITRNGEGDTVLLSLEAFEQLAKEPVAQSANERNNLQKEARLMSESFYGKVLRNMYDTAAKGLQVANIHLFGIYYAEILEMERLSKKEILRAAGLSETYQTEISKAMNLARYTQVRPAEIQRIKAIETACGKPAEEA